MLLEEQVLNFFKGLAGILVVAESMKHAQKSYKRNTNNTTVIKEAALQLLLQWGTSPEYYAYISIRIFTIVFIFNWCPFSASAIKHNSYCPALSKLVNNELQTASSQVLNGHTDGDGVFAQACCCEF